MYIKIKTIESVPDKYGSHLKITKIGLYEDNDKFVRWVKLNDAIKEILSENKIPVK